MGMALMLAAAALALRPAASGAVAPLTPRPASGIGRSMDY
jgi:hypothetical protein